MSSASSLFPLFPLFFLLLFLLLLLPHTHSIVTPEPSEPPPIPDANTPPVCIPNARPLNQNWTASRAFPSSVAGTPVSWAVCDINSNGMLLPIMATTAGVFQPPLSALPALQHEWAFIVRDFEPRESVELTLELGTGMVCGNVLADNTRQLLLGGSTLRMHRVPPYPSRQLIDPNPVTLLALSAPTGQLADVSLRVPWGDLATDVYALGSQQLLFYCGAAGTTPSYGASSSAAASPSSSSPAAWADTVFVNGSTMLLTCHPSGGLRIHRVDTTLARSSCDSDPVVDSQLLLDPGVGCLSADVGDLDRDGSPDIVVATSLGLVWLRGPAFAPAALPTFEPLPHPPVAVHLASLTLEHSLDVVVSFNNTDPPLFSAFSEDSADWKPLVNSTLNSSAWRFFPHVTRDWSGQGEVHLFAVARSADSTDELVFVTPSSDAVQLPRVHFGPIQPMDFGGDEVFSADVDDDGIPDLIANGDDGAVYYWDRIKWIYITTTKPATPDAPCGFAFNSRVQSESSTKLNRECDRVVAHDIDGDGTREIVCGHYWNLQYFRLDPTDGVWRVANDSFSHPLEDADGELTFVDFDNDGVAELMVQQRDSVRTFYVPLNQTTQRFCTKFSEYDANYCDAMNAVELLNLESKYVVGVADITKNGFRDIMADRFVANKGGYFDPINDGVPQRPLAEGLDFFNTGMDPYNQLYAADLNGDGLHDLLTFGSDFQTPSLSFLRGESPNGTYPFGYPEPQAQVERNTNLEFHVLHDWDLDGNLDLLGSSYFGSWVYTNPRGNGHGRLHHLPLIGLKRMHVGDFDSDGDLDSLGPDGTGIFENLSHDPSRTRIVELRVDYDTGSDFACSQRHQWTVSGTQLPCRTIGGAIRAAASFSGGPVRIELLGSRANVTEPLSVHGILGRKVTIDIPADGFELDCSFLATRTASRHQGASCVTFSSTLSSVRFRGGQLTVSGWNVSAFPSARGAVTFGFTNFDDTTVSHEAALGLWCNQTDLNNLAGCKSTDANTYFGPSAASQHWLRIVGAQSVTSGACLRIEHAGNLTLRGVSLVDCRSSNRGGAVAIVDSTNVRLLRFHVASARADLEGGALTVVRSSHVSLEDGVIEDCESLVSGGGLHLEDILGLSLTRLTVRGCRAPRCAGAQFVASELSGVDRIAALKSCAFESNRAEVSTGGGLCASSIRLDVSGSFTLRNNTAVTDGGGAHVETGGIRSSDGCILSVLHNRAERGDGGGIVSVNSAIEVHGEDTSATVAHNTALEGTGGGIAADGVSTVEFAVTGFVNVSHNSADLGGGLSCVGTAASSNSRLRVAWAAGVPDLHHFSFNTARRGGGVYALLCQVSLGYVHLFRNEATLAGGGAHITTTYYSTILSTTTFTGCSVRGEGAGGALYISIPSLDAASFYVWAKFFNNSVPLGSGGAVYFEAGDGTSAPQLDSNPGGVAGNTALAGPVYASSARSLDILHSSSVDTQVSRAPFTGDLVYELRDVFGQRAAGDSTAQVRLNVLSSSDERASFLGRDTQIRATAGVANFTAKDVQLEAPPGSRVVVEVGTLPAFLEVQNRTFEVVMQDCLPGSFVQDGLRCRPCSRGQSSAVVNAAECELCPEHTIARREGQAQCEPCLPPSFSLGRGGLECSLCTANQYALFPANRSFTECRRCPAFTRCYTDGRVEAVSGFWADFDPQTGAYHAFRCPRRDNCESGSCQAGRVDADDNPLCGRCLDGLTDWIGECLECESTRWDLVLVLTALCLLVVGMLHVLAQDIKGGEVDVLLYYAQTVVLVVGSDRVSVLYVLESLNLNFALASGPNCISPLEQHEQLLLHLVSPLFVYVAWLLLLGASALLRRCSTAEFRFAPWVRSLVALYVFSFNSQATAIVEYFHCIEVTHRGATVEVNESFPAVSCTSQEWEDLWPLASALAAVFLVLVPASLLVAVVWSRRPGRAPRLQQMLGIMTQMYRPRVWAWGFVVLLRRALLVIAAVQLAEEPLDRLVVLSMLNTVFCVSAIVVKPWKSAGDNTADGVALSLLTVLTMFLPLLDEPYSDLTNAVLGVSILLPTVGFVLWTLRTKFQRLCGKAQPGVESKSDPTASTPLSSPRHHSKRKLSGVGPSSSRPSSLELSSLS